MDMIVLETESGKKKLQQSKNVVKDLNLDIIIFGLDELT